MHIVNHEVNIDSQSNESLIKAEMQVMKAYADLCLWADSLNLLFVDNLE